MRSSLAHGRPMLAGVLASAALVVAGPAGADPHAQHRSHGTAAAHAASYDDSGAGSGRAASHHDGVDPADSSGTHRAAAMSSAFVVGTPGAPLITGPVRGPLASVQQPPMHVGVAGGSPRAVSSDVIATRLVLTKAQATKRLSKSCQRLVKAKRPSKLSKRDRKKRTACLEQRRRLIADSKKEKPPTAGVNAPPAAQPGPTPVAPPITGPMGPPPPQQPPAPTSTTPTQTTPTTPKYTWEPCTPSGSTIGATSYDAFQRYTLTRGCAPAGDITFTFTNIDDSGSRPHNLFLAAVDAKGEIAGAPVEIVGLRENGDGGSGTLTVKAGRYLLICTVDGHQGMNTPFQVY